MVICPMPKNKRRGDVTTYLRRSCKSHPNIYCNQSLRNDDFMLAGKIEVDPDAEAEAVATICMISTPPEIRVAESKYIFSLSVP